MNTLFRRIPLAPRVVVALLTLFGALTLAALYSPSVGAQGSGDATLSALAINDGTSAVDLNPGFTSAGTSYRTAVKYRDERLTVTATKNEANATIVFLDRSDAILDDGDLNTDGHQLDVPVGDSIFKIKVTAQDNTELVYEVTVERNDANLFGWTPTRDLNGLTDAGNDNPQGIWSNGTTMWVADDDDDKLYAYTLATGARDSARDITSLAAAGNDSPRGIWSNGTTMWVVDSVDHQLYAYTLATGARDSVKDITLDPANGAPWGIWSDGTIIWVTNDNDLRLYAYTLDGGTRQTDIEFLLSGDTRAPRGIWSDGSTLWVSSLTFDATHPLVAYTLDFSLNNGGRVGNLHGLPDWGKSFYTPGTLQLMGAGIWSDGDTAIWLASTGPAGKIHSFNTLPSQAGGVSLSSLTVNDGTTNVGLLPEFNLNDVVYWTSVVNDVNVVTVSATASNSEATVEYVNEDADQSSGHQVDVVEGTTPIGILVTTLDGAALIHQVYVERDSSRFGGWTPTKDIHGLVAAGIANPTGIWSDGTTMWVVDYLDLKLYAYTLATGARNEDREFDLDPANASPHGLWSDGRTIWVGSRSTVNLKLFAYTLKDDTTTTGTDAKGQREPTKDILLDASNNAASGIWSNETDTVWVAEQLEDKLYAYTLNIGSDGLAGPNHGMRKTGSDITLQGSANLWGIWSDGTTMWEGDNSAKSIRAYTLATGEREESKDIPFAPYQSHTWGIWSDGSTMWTVHDKSQRLPYVYTRIFSHTLPTSGGATTLSNLTVTLSPEVPSFTATLRPTFSSATDIYRVAVPNAAALVTISPTLSDNAATATYQDKDGGTLADVDTNKTGHQVSVPVGAFVINIKITKTGEPSITYTVVVERDSAEPFGWTPSKDLNTFYQDNPEADGQVPRGVWGDETTLYAAPHNTAKVFAFNRSDGTRNQAKDIVVFSDFPVNNSGRLEPIIFAGIWSDGTTMWVVDYNKVHDDQGMDKNNPNQVEQAHGKFFAYNLLDGERDKTKEFVLDSIHSDSVRGVWSDGTTVWVSDYKLQKLIAYHLKDNSGTNENEFGTRDEAKDITLHSDNGVPQGIWSDGDTMWVADWDDDKFYAYVLATGARAESQEFNLIPDNGYPRDVWSDGMTMWVPDAVAKKFFSYRMPPDGTTTTTPGVTVSETALTVTEEDVTGDSYTVVLDSQPTADVTVTVAGYSGTAVTPTPSTLTFTSVNWDMSQTVTVKAGDDADTENDTVTLTHSAASTDSNYDGSSITIDDVTVTVTDDDIDTTAGICGRTEEVRDALVELIPGVSDCAAVTDADLAAITGPLDLSSQNITALAAGDFAGLTALTEMDLNNNGLTGLTADVFAGLTALEILYLHNNGPTELTADLFARLTALEQLNLEYNQLTTLPVGVFAGLTMLEQLNLENNQLNTLPVGVFEGLSSLDILGLDNNELTTLPAGVFEGLSSLRSLSLHDNQLNTLPVGVFDGLTALTLLHLRANELNTLPGRVFEPLISLVELWLVDNPGVPFAPTADALPDDGTVSNAGGTVTLDGSGSDGGPWGTNVTYAWALTTPTSGVTFDDATSATPEVTIQAPTAGAELIFTLTVTGRGDRESGTAVATDTATVTVNSPATGAPIISGTAEVGKMLTAGISAIMDADGVPGSLTYQWVRVDSDGSNTAEISGATSNTYPLVAADVGKKLKVKVSFTDNAGNSESLTSDAYPSSGTIVPETANTAPTFNDGGSTTRTFDETVGDATVTSAADIGTPVSATDPDTGDTLEYRLEGTDRTKFGINATSGQIRTKVGENYDYEARTSYSVRVTVNDGTVTVSSAVTINVTDQDEPPLVMNQPVVTATANSTTSLEVSWTEPSNPGRPDIDSYDLQYRVGSNGGFSNGPQDETGSSAAIGNLTADTSYEVRVRATNAEGDGVWSPSGTGNTGTTTITTDPPGVTVSPTALTVAEEDTTGDSYTVVLDSQPTAEVVVTVAGHAGTEVTPSPTSLTFTRSNWDTGQTVTVTAGADTDTVNDTVTLTHSAASADSNYDGSSITIASVTVTVTDDDIDTAAGICGRTEEVRDALVELIPGVSDCAAVTAADLAAITGPLNLSGQNISVLAAGDFAGLTALEVLYLNNNGLTTLPKDVFAGLTRLEVLTLYYNELTTLPDGVFGQLTALNFLYLGDNPRAPFAPTAVARPDAGTVPVAGGTVTLDGSGSGGPWGTNVTYRWALTTPASGVTFDDATSATPEVTIPNLAAGTELTFTLTVTGRGGTDGIETATDTARVTATQNITNNPPVFPGGTVQARTFDETIGDTAVTSAADIGTPVSATDLDTGDTLEYRLEGTDRTKFGINATSGQIRTKVGENYDYEARTGYSVTVAVTDGTVTVSSAVTINVTDQDEPPPVMNKPVVTATADSTTSLEVSWTAPSNPGRPGIGSYDLQYRVGSTGDFSNGPQNETGSSAAIGNLTADTSYEVRVRATNAEGDGVWSPSGTGRTNAEDNDPPTFDEGGSPSRTFNETIGDATVGAAADIGTPVSATDPDTGDRLEYRLEGTDRTKFGIIATSGQIRTKVGENYDYEARTSYSVRVTVNDGTVTVSSTVTINVTDQDEPPPVMNKPVVTATANSTTSLEVSWTAPSNTGRPRIGSYDLQYRVGNTGDFSNGPQNQTGSSAAIGNLTADTSYEVQVRATNAEGDGVWSPSGTGQTNAEDNAAPGVTVSPTALTVTEEDPTGESYTVVLDSQPTAEVVVTVAGHSGTAVTPTPTSLTFTTSNWDTGQAVTVTAGSDADTVNDTVTLTHSAASADSDYDGNSITIASVTVTVTDDDTGNAAGICGRTEEVRDALVELIPGVSDCAAVTDANLAAITDTLNLSGQNITELAAGDFAGLTGLIELYLNNNGLETLPKDVFAGLPVLKVLTLYYNDLETLPDGVFEPLTALNFLYLGDNPRAPFAPTAVALPDAGTVAVAGGTVTLDGSGSGGPWGTNVTYRWALTTPASGVRVTFDDSTSATPEVAIPTLAAGTELTFTLTVTGRGGTDGIETATDSARVTATQNITNNPPVFAGEAGQARTFNETIGDATVTSASDIGTPVSATDPDTGDTLTYVLLGADRAKFTFDTSSGQIRTKVGENYDYEARTSYSVRVAVIDGTVTVSSTVTINVTDQDEPPPVMNQPVVTATANSTTSLEVSWTESSNPGRPDIDSYDLQYRAGNTGGFINGPQDVTGSSAAIGNLTADTSYEVQVRASNAEGDGVWSPSGTGQTNAEDNAAPGVTVSPTALTVTEEDPTGESYRVVLDSQPTADVVVTVAGHAGTAVTPTPPSLTFTTSNWDTDQTVRVTAGSDADTVNDTVTLTHGAASADSDYDGNSITIASVTVTVTDNDIDNAAPTFNEGGSTTRTFDETVGDATVGAASDIGTPVSATDPDTGDTLEYRLEGTDRTKFGINATSGQIRTKVGENYDYEARTSYSVRVTVNDGTVTVSSAVTINVTDQDEPPLVMNQPVVTATANSTTSLEVSWTEPSNPGRPDIDSYDLQYRVGSNGGFSNGPQDETGSSAAIGNLTADTSYEVRVRATNAEGDGVWSPSGTGTTGTTTITTDPPGVTVSPTALTVTEEDPTGESYTVVLDSQPTAEVTVTVAGHAGTEVTPSPTSLTFTTSNWDTAQTITVTAAADADLVNDTVTLTHSAESTDSDYDGNSITIVGVTVTVTDDDTGNAAGICGRTEEVRDALVELIPGVSGCAAVTDANLAAITGPLDLSGQNISVLAAGDFAGLTGLIELYLNNNGLTTLRGDVFAGLTALTQLQLNNNELETLPKDVFAELPVLKLLTLYDNELEKLPDGVFETLTALAYLGLYGNPGAPFAPTAVALPDDGTVPVAGGTVTLDGSGSDGGPWGTNVTYRWALTTPASGVRVTFDDSTSATPEATIPTLAAGTELAFTLTVTGPGGTQGTAPGTDTATVTATDSVIASTDATLGTLRVNDGTRELTLAPAFASGTFASMRRRWATRSRRSR